MEMTLTKNFWTCVHTLLFGCSSDHPVGYVYQSSNGLNSYSMNTIGSFTDIDNNTQTLVAGDSGNYQLAYALQMFPFGYSNGNYFEVGSGSTPATINDNIVASPISDATISVTGQQSADGSITFHVTVTASANITIREICLLKNLYTRVTSGTNYRVLIGRAVLPEGQEVTLTNGQSKTFDVTISLPKPTA